MNLILSLVLDLADKYLKPDNMLNSESIEIIKQTAPFLQERGKDITKRFYQNLFLNHPELKNMFNMASQASGRQQESLAQSILSFANYVDEPNLLKDMLGKISNKHASLDVQKSHYPIVGKYLLASIQEELKTTKDDPIIIAWEEAYNFLAKELIISESKIYENLDKNQEGWLGFKEFTLIKRKRETNNIISFFFEPKDGKPLPIFKPGQNISIKLKTTECEFTQIRNYTLSNVPNKNYFKISVKKVISRSIGIPNGLVSCHLHDNLQIGNTILIHAPTGNFCLDTPIYTPVVLISNGIGITPMISMVHSLNITKHKNVNFIHCTKNSETHAFKFAIQKLALENHNIKQNIFYKNPMVTDQPGRDFDFSGNLNLNKLNLKREADFYICGSSLFLNNVIKQLKDLGINQEQLKFETFEPTQNFHCPVKIQLSY